MEVFVGGGGTGPVHSCLRHFKFRGLTFMEKTGLKAGIVDLKYFKL